MDKIEIERCRECGSLPRPNVDGWGRRALGYSCEVCAYIDRVKESESSEIAAIRVWNEQQRAIDSEVAETIEASAEDAVATTIGAQ